MARVRELGELMATSVGARAFCVPTHERPGELPGRLSLHLFGRDGGIRTHDPLTPSQVRYQAALHPEN